MDTRTALLDSAEHLVRTRGFDAFSYADLSRDVGIRKASIHHHFPAKADLANTLIQRYCETFDAKLDEIEQTHSVAGTQLAAYLSLYRDALGSGDQVCLCVAIAGARNTYDARVIELLNKFHENSTDWLSRLYACAQQDRSVGDVNEPMQEAIGTLALVEGAQLIARAAGSADLFDRAVSTLAARITLPPTLGIDT